MDQKSQDFQVSPIHASTILQTRERDQQGLYYNSNYAIENFIQLYQDHSNGDPFKVLNDATYSGFKIFFHFDATDGLLADEKYTNSALAYLKRIGAKEQYDLLKRFITTLSKVNSICPWIFQEITGLRELYELEWGTQLHVHEIEIQTLETIDHKIHSLVEMYRRIAYDSTRRVYILPDNLRDFSMSVYIYDYRMFDSTSKTAVDLLQTIKNTDVRQLNHVMFDLGECQFTEKSGGQFFDSVSNNRNEANTNNLVIRTQKFETSSLFKTITGDTKLNNAFFEIAKVSQGTLEPVEKSNNYISRLKNTELFQSAQDRVNEYKELLDKDTWKRKLEQLQGEGEQRLLNRAEAELTRLYLGNVHGFGFDDLVRLNQDKDFRTAFAQLYSTESTNQSLRLGNTQVEDLGNVNN